MTVALKEHKTEKLFYTMGEVAEMFDVNQSLIRFWEQRFAILKPKKNKKGNRLFTPADVKNLEIIYHLVKERGMTLTGAEKYLKDNKNNVERETEIVRKLQEIKSLLTEIREELKDETPLPVATTAFTPNERPAETFSEETEIVPREPVDTPPTLPEIPDEDTPAENAAANDPLYTDEYGILETTPWKNSQSEILADEELPAPFTPQQLFEVEPDPTLQPIDRDTELPTEPEVSQSPASQDTQQSLF